jgi:hypothetical protein
MKKKLEADLMSIAHRVLQMKNKSDINQLYIETQKLYEKLSVLRFVEEHFGDAKPTIGQAEIVQKIKHFFDEIHITDQLTKNVQQEIVAEEQIIIEEVKEEVFEEIVINKLAEEVQEEEGTLEVVAEVVDEEKETLDVVAEEEIEESKDLDFLPAFELDEEEEEEAPSKSEEAQISFMDLLGSDYSEPMFVKVESSDKTISETSFKFDKNGVVASVDVKTKNIDAKSVSLNDKFAKGINIGLNDRIAFVKHLFGNSDEDYNRVMNQLITYDNFEEAQNFIDDMVKPDYNSWEGKEEYSQRFIEIIEKKFA